MIKNPSSLVGGHKPGASGVAGFIRLNKTGGNIWDWFLRMKISSVCALRGTNLLAVATLEDTFEFTIQVANRSGHTD